MTRFLNHIYTSWNHATVSFSLLLHTFFLLVLLNMHLLQLCLPRSFVLRYLFCNCSSQSILLSPLFVVLDGYSWYSHFLETKDTPLQLCHFTEWQEIVDCCCSWLWKSDHMVCILLLYLNFKSKDDRSGVRSEKRRWQILWSGFSHRHSLDCSFVVGLAVYVLFSVKISPW